MVDNALTSLSEQACNGLVESMYLKSLALWDPPLDQTYVTAMSQTTAPG